MHEILKRFRKKIFKVVKKTGLHEPNFDQSDIKEVSKCIKSSFVSTYGYYVSKFEESLKKFTKSKYVIATNTGTSALHIALKLVGVRKDTNVILPTLSLLLQVMQLFIMTQYQYSLTLQRILFV